MKRQPSVWIDHMDKTEWKSEYPECTMYELLAQTAERVPNKIALVFEGKKITFKQLMKMIEKTAKALNQFNIKKGDVVSIISPNMPQAVYMFYAVNKFGAIANMIHPLLSVNEIKESIENTKTKVILILDQIFPKIAKINWEGIEYPNIILTKVIDALPVYAKPIYSLTNKKKAIQEHKQKTIFWNDFLQASAKYQPQPPLGDHEDVAAIMFSGGTTGTPKGVMLTNDNFNCMYGQLYDISGFSYSIDMKLKTLALVPIFHGFGLGVCIHAMLCYGVCSYLIPIFSFEKCIDLIFKKKIQLIFGVPALFEVLARSTQIETKDLSFIKMLVSGGDKLPLELQERVNDYMQKGNSTATLREAYGQTECVCACCVSPFFKPKEGSAGIAYPDMLLKVVTPNTTEEVPEGVDGELCVCGPTVMKGYFNNENETNRAIQIHSDGKRWLHTGDMVSMDNEGYIFYKQRLSRMIISSGYNIYLGQIEEVVQQCPSVEVCCATGIDDKAVGKRIDLFVELKNKNVDKALCEKELRKLCDQNLPQYSQPQRIIFIDKIPRTSMGKIDYKLLSEQGEK